VCAVTVFGAGLLEILVPQGLESMHILPVAFRGSLIATVLFFGPPLVLLGVAPPFLVRMATRGGHTGRTAGVLLAWTTVGGLLGCFVTAPFLVPALGAKGTLLGAALLLSIVAAAALLPGVWRHADGRRGLLAWGIACVLGVVPALLLARHLAQRQPLRLQPGQVTEVESAYQTIRVVREEMGCLVPFDQVASVPAMLGDDGSAWTVFLRHDEDAETYQSVLLEDPELSKAWLTGGRYFEHMALGAHFARPSAATLRVLIVGYAGGTVHRTLRETMPEGVELSVLGVEIDAEVIEVAREHLRHRDLEGPGLELVTGEDARTVVNALPADRRFDLVLVDAYARTNYVPFQLATVEFFERLEAHLRPGGWIGVNVLGHGMKSPVAHAVAATMDRALGASFVTPNPSFLGNVILWGAPDTTRGPRLRADAVLHPGLEAAAFALERLTVRHDPKRDGGIVLTDDKSPSDRLADEELGL
jgi:spermidine synthase